MPAKQRSQIKRYALPPKRSWRAGFDANLGAHLVKQRVSEGEGGRSNSQRAIVVVKKGEHLVFLHMFPKNAQTTPTPSELEEFRDTAKIIAGFSSDTVK